MKTLKIRISDKNRLKEININTNINRVSYYSRSQFYQYFRQHSNLAGIYIEAE